MSAKNITAFTNTRSTILAALATAGIGASNILISSKDIPDILTVNFSAAVVKLAKEKGKDESRTRFNSSDLGFEVFLLVDNCSDATDPDLALYTLKEAFRDAYQTAMNKDFAEVEYYDGQVDASHPVRIAKLLTQTEKN